MTAAATWGALTFPPGARVRELDPDQPRRADLGVREHPAARALLVEAVVPRHVDDIVPAPAIVQRTRPRRLLADKAYSTHDFRAVLAAMDCDPVIPSSSSWINPLPYDKELYKARAEVECTFSLLKQARRFATRYEKTLRNYAAVVAIGCALLWLRI